MKVIYGLKNLKAQKKRSIVTIGIFDGVHLGHRKILQELVNQAKAKKLLSVVLTFSPHPQKVLYSETSKSTIISIKHRLELLKIQGIGLCLVIKFTRAFSKKPIDWFIKQILVKKLKATSLVVGSRFKLGKEAIPAKRLKKLLKGYGLSFEVIPAQEYRGKDISSSLIRKLIETGKLDIAAKLLGRRVTIYGTVIGGERRGRIIGFRTANIDPHHEVIPPSGVYAVKVKARNRFYNGLLNIGFRPTFKAPKRHQTIEVHLLNFNSVLYNNSIEVLFIKKIRPEKRFKNKNALVKQIKKDIKRAPFFLYNV